MPDLNISIESVEVTPFAAAPSLTFQLRLVNDNREERIHSVMLRCQIQIEVTRRQYSSADQERLRDLFGEPARWGQTLRNLLWTNAAVVAAPFTGETTVDLQVPCSFDFTIPTTKYFYGLTDGDIPVRILFSGTVFYEDSSEALRVAPISWEKEAAFRMPLKIWKQMMDEYYPNCAWLCLRRDIFEDLHRFKTARGIPTWEETLAKLLAASPETAPA